MGEALKERRYSGERTTGKISSVGWKHSAQIVRDEGLTEAELRSGSRKKKISKARRLFCQLAVVKLGYPGAQVARFLVISTSAVVRADISDELSEIGSHL